MYQGLRRLLKQSSLLVKINSSWRKKVALAKCELTDIYDSYLSKSTKPQMTPYGFKLAGSKSMHHIAMQRGEFEPKETALFMAEFQKADVFIDVGANIGFYSCLARSQGKHVVAVEPLPRNLGYLVTNLLANDWEDIEIFPVGLSEQPSLATLYGASSTGASLIGSWAGASRYFQRTIPLSTLDILLGNRFNGKKIFIKIDVEGVEYSVLLGAIATMELNPKPTWVIEICLNEYHPNGINPNFHDTFNLFWQHGYEVRTADSANKLIRSEDVDRWIQSGRCDSGTINYKLVPL